MASNGTITNTTIVQGLVLNAPWVNAVTLTSLALSMAVNILVTGLIVFKVFKAFLVVRATMTSAERTQALAPGLAAAKYRHIIFILIESGMALFSIQLVRVVLYAVQTVQSDYAYPSVICINQMFNVIIRSAYYFYFFCFTDDIYLARASHQQYFWCGSQ